MVLTLGPWQVWSCFEIFKTKCNEMGGGGGEAWTHWHWKKRVQAQCTCTCTFSKSILIKFEEVVQKMRNYLLLRTNLTLATACDLDNATLNWSLWLVRWGYFLFGGWSRKGSIRLIDHFANIIYSPCIWFLIGYKAKKSTHCFITVSGGRISRHWYKPHTISLLCR